jgi:hypothetical protein
MRFGLLDLLIGCGTAALAAIVGVWLRRFLPATIAFPLSILVGFGFYLLITPPIYRYFHLEPLLLPRCPHCRNIDRLYYAPKAKPDWPISDIYCAWCGKTLELWYDNPEHEPPDRGVVRFKLVWPQSFGRWRQLPPGSENSADRHVATLDNPRQKQNLERINGTGFGEGQNDSTTK